MKLFKLLFIPSLVFNATSCSYKRIEGLTYLERPLSISLSCLNYATPFYKTYSTQEENALFYYFENVGFKESSEGENLISYRGTIYFEYEDNEFAFIFQKNGDCYFLDENTSTWFKNETEFDMISVVSYAFMNGTLTNCDRTYFIV